MKKEVAVCDSVSKYEKACVCACRYVIFYFVFMYFQNKQLIFIYSIIMEQTDELTDRRIERHAEKQREEEHNGPGKTGRERK